MNGFSDHGLDEGSFGEKGGIVKAFDAFRRFLYFILLCHLLHFQIFYIYCLPNGYLIWLFKKSIPSSNPYTNTSLPEKQKQNRNT